MKRLFKSFGYAFSGFKAVVQSEANMQIHLFAAFIVLLLAYAFDLESWEWAVILLCIMIVMATEILNTIIEKYLDFYHPEISNQVKVLKDMAAACVLMTAIIAWVIGMIIFLPKVISFFL